MITLKKMGRRVIQMKFVAVAVVVVATLLQSVAGRRTFVVGDGLGWTVPPRPNTYAIWASNHSFAVNDILLFSFKSGNSTVAKVRKEAYESCNTSVGPMFIRRQSTAFIFLNSSGNKFFIDSIGDHCLKGQKLSIKVNPLAPSQPPANNPTPPTSSPPSPPSSSPSSPPSRSPPPSSSTTPPPTTTPGPAFPLPLGPTTPPTQTPPNSNPPPPPSSATIRAAPVAVLFMSFAFGYLLSNSYCF